MFYAPSRRRVLEKVRLLPVGLTRALRSTLLDRYVVCQVTQRTIASAMMTPTRGTIVTMDVRTGESERRIGLGKLHTSSRRVSTWTAQT